MALDLSSLSKAISALEASINISKNRDIIEKLNQDAINTIQAGVIQHFEFTYELCWKFIQRWIKINKGSNDADPRTKKDLFRLAARFKLIREPEPWFSFSEARNLTSHTCDLDVARQVYHVSVKFLPESKFLLQQLTKHND